MYEWLLILATHVYGGSVVSFERFANKTECIAAQSFFIDSHKSQGIMIETKKSNELQITCMQVKKL